KETISGSDGATIAISRSDATLTIEYHSTVGTDRTIFVAIASHREIGSAVIPFSEKDEGSTVFLSFKADRLFAFRLGANNSEASLREWKNWQWQEAHPAEGIDAKVNDTECTVRIPLSAIGSAKNFDL